MLELSDSTPEMLAGRPRNYMNTMASLASMRSLEIELNLAQLHAVQEQERHEQFLKNLASYWPLAVGLAVSLFAPVLRDLAGLIQPWGMRLLFPFAVLSQRPELNLGPDFFQMLPSVMLYLQFPFEGLLVRMFLKRRVSLGGVVAQLLLLHFACAGLLWLLSRAGA